MRKSGWTAAAGIGSLVLLLAACGGSSNSAAGSPSSAPLASSGSSGAAVPSSAPASSATAAATATKSGSKKKAKPHKSVAPLPSGGDQSIPAVGTTVMIVQNSAIGYVLAEANHQVVYTYSKDKKDGKPTCTGACAATWIPATGTPQAGPADVFSGQFGLVTRCQRGQADHLQRPSALPAQGREAAGDNRQRPGRRLARGQALRQQHPLLTRFIPVRHLAIARP